MNIAELNNIINKKIVSIENIRYCDNNTFDPIDYGYLKFDFSDNTSILFSCGNDGVCLFINDIDAINIFTQILAPNDSIEGFIRFNILPIIETILGKKIINIHKIFWNNYQGRLRNTEIIGIMFETEFTNLLLYNGGDNLILKINPILSSELCNFSGIVISKSDGPSFTEYSIS